MHISYVQYLSVQQHSFIWVVMVKIIMVAHFSDIRKHLQLQYAYGMYVAN